MLSVYSWQKFVSFEYACYCRAKAIYCFIFKRCIDDNCRKLFKWIKLVTAVVLLRNHRRLQEDFQSIFFALLVSQKSAISQCVTSKLEKSPLSAAGVFISLVDHSLSMLKLKFANKSLYDTNWVFMEFISWIVYFESSLVRRLSVSQNQRTDCLQGTFCKLHWSYYIHSD